VYKLVYMRRQEAEHLTYDQYLTTYGVVT